MFRCMKQKTKEETTNDLFLLFFFSHRHNYINKTTENIISLGMRPNKDKYKQKPAIHGASTTVEVFGQKCFKFLHRSGNTMEFWFPPWWKVITKIRKPRHTMLFPPRWIFSCKKMLNSSTMVEIYIKNKEKQQTNQRKRRKEASCGALVILIWTADCVAYDSLPPSYPDTLHFLCDRNVLLILVRMLWFHIQFWIYLIFDRLHFTFRGSTCTAAWLVIFAVFFYGGNSKRCRSISGGYGLIISLCSVRVLFL